MKPNKLTMYITSNHPPVGNRQRGAVILILVTVIVLTLTTVVVSQLSINRQRLNRGDTTAQALNAAREALIGYALRQNPPGVLPCPDNNGDGQGDAALGGCVTQRGFLPFRTLGLAQFKDGSGSQLWYAVEPNYTATASFPKNSSSTSGLTLDGVSVAAVIIAPGSFIPPQQRTPNNFSGGLTGGNSAANTADEYLEDVNGDNNRDTYATANSDTNNDSLIGIDVRTFWTTIERRVLAEAVRSAKKYKACFGEYPWASNFGTSDSVNGLKSGGFPSDTALALPSAWSANCTAPSAPTSITPLPESWLNSDWGDQLLYSFCLTSENNCISITGDVASTVEAVIIAPGVDLSGNRPSTALGDYFEKQNAAGSATQFEYYSPANHDGTFNDVLRSF